MIRSIPLTSEVTVYKWHFYKVKGASIEYDLENKENEIITLRIGDDWSKDKNLRWLGLTKREFIKELKKQLKIKQKIKQK